MMGIDLKTMNIQTNQSLGDDGKPMTPEQVALSSLKKEHTSLQKKYSELEKRISELEANQQEAVRKAGKGPKF